MLLLIKFFLASEVNYFRIQDNKSFGQNNNYDNNESVRVYNENTTTTRTKRSSGIASHQHQTDYESSKLRITRGGGVGRGRGKKNNAINSTANFLLNSMGKVSISNTSNTVVSVTSVAPPTSTFTQETNLVAIQQQQVQEQQQPQTSISPQQKQQQNNNNDQQQKHLDSIDNSVIINSALLPSNIVTTSINEIGIATSEILTPASQYQVSS